MSLIHCTPTPIWKIHWRGGAITSKRRAKKKTGFLCTGKQQSRLFWKSSSWRSFPKAAFLLLARSCKKLFACRLEAKPKRKSYVFKNSHVSMDKTSVPTVIKIRGKGFFDYAFDCAFFGLSTYPLLLHRSVPECTAFTGLWEAAAAGCRSRGFRVKVSLLSILLARFILLSCGRRRDNLNRWFNSTRSHFKQTSRYQSSLSLSEAFFSPPCKKPIHSLVSGGDVKCTHSTRQS